eukprot:m.497669 g.497669  ORF g.497669 m.497669 type:complete len:105 (-) comp51966_c0_seq1:34-348(-)
MPCCSSVYFSENCPNPSRNSSGKKSFCAMLVLNQATTPLLIQSVVLLSAAAVVQARPPCWVQSVATYAGGVWAIMKSFTEINDTNENGTGQSQPGTLSLPVRRY